jgi:CRISPR-associated protein (TIGR03984 family)
MPAGGRLMKNLYHYHQYEITLESAVDSCKNHLQAAIGLLYSPKKCELVKLDNSGKLVDSYNRLKFNNLGVFEARFFNLNCELRWVNESNGNGTAVLLSESDITLTGFEKGLQEFITAIDQQYLLWGEPAKHPPNADGWQRLAEARIGKLDIPLDNPLKPKDRVFLTSEEYIAEVDDFGNCAVIDERLIKLEVK